MVYIPGAADIRNENTNQEKATAVSKEDKIIEYIRQNGSISSQKAADIGGYKSKTGARKLLDKMIEKGLITKIGNGPATKSLIIALRSIYHSMLIFGKISIVLRSSRNLELTITMLRQLILV